MRQRVFNFLQTYERHLSALAMIAGFIADNLLFERIDLLQTQAVFAAYTLTCFIAIPLQHALETRAELGAWTTRWRAVLPFFTQFALGGFWSGFVIFYGRSADFGASWPFLLFLVVILIINEYFHHYHDRLVFTSVLFFFALYSYAIFAVPIYTGTIGTITFLESGLIAIIVFAFFVLLLRFVARTRFLPDAWRIRAGAGVVLVLMNVFYFANILPPLPLAAKEVGIYHNVWRVPGDYMATTESEPWVVRYLGFAPTLHLVRGDSAAAYSSVFAPTTLKTSVRHRWQWYDALKKQWVTAATISYSIEGGRDGGYRGYSMMPIVREGEWRVEVLTVDGRLITRLPFTVAFGTTTPTETINLN